MWVNTLAYTHATTPTPVAAEECLQNGLPWAEARPPKINEDPYALLGVTPGEKLQDTFPLDASERSFAFVLVRSLSSH